MPTDINKIRDSRISAQEIWEVRGTRENRYGEWHSRLDELDNLYSGNWQIVFPGETAVVELPNIMNMIQVGMEDIAKLTSESKPTIKCSPFGNTQDAQRNAYMREAVGNTYWDVNRADVFTPRLALDLAGAGACFMASTADKKTFPYPVVHRIDPRHAFPDVHDGKLQDLLVVQVLLLRQAARLFPMLGLDDISPDRADSVELLEYYGNDEVIQAISLSRDGQPAPYSESTPVQVIKRWPHKLGRPPVAFSMLDSFDGQFRGMFDQIKGSLKIKNRIVKLMMDYTDRLVYAPKVSKGLLNPEERDGPDAHYRLDPNTPDARMDRLPPAGSSPQLFGLLEYLDREQRGGTSYPAARQGQVTQSIASASFVASTQGQLTSTVRNIQRLIAYLRQDMNAIMFELDEKHLNFEKPLTRPVGRKREYKPKETLGGVYQNKVIYGASAGLDRTSADVRILQFRQAGLISGETAREQLDFLDEKSEEGERIKAERAEEVMAAKFFEQASLEDVTKVYTAMQRGVAQAKAIADTLEERQAEIAAQPPPGLPPGPPPGAGGGPLGAEQQQVALARGGRPGPPEQNGFQGPPLEEMLAGRRR
jgi:hypothetical protein